MKNKKEGFDLTTAPNEAVANLSKLYNDQTGELKLSNLTVTGDLNVVGKSTLGKIEIFDDHVGKGGDGTVLRFDDNGWVAIRKAGTDEHRFLHTGELMADNVVSNYVQSGTAHLGSWDIANDRIGIAQRGELWLGDDKWLRYGPNGSTEKYGWSTTGTSVGINPGFSTGNMYGGERLMLRSGSNPDIKTILTGLGSNGISSIDGSAISSSDWSAPPVRLLNIK